MPAGRPTLYRDEYVDEVVSFCAQGYSLTGFAGEIGVGRDTISEWVSVHPEFSAAVNRAKAARARWWEDQARKVAGQGGPGGQATMVIFGLKNHAPDDYADKQQHEITGKDGGPISIEARRAEAQAVLSKVLMPAEMSEERYRRIKREHPGYLEQTICPQCGRLIGEPSKKCFGHPSAATAASDAE